MAVLGALALLSILTAIPFSQASEHRRSLPLSHNYFNRRQTVPTRLPGGWTSRGCVVDSTAVRTLDGASFTNTTGMTVESCIGFCSQQSFIYAGVEFSQECYCGNVVGAGGTNVSLSECNSPCTGNPAESCGAGGRLNLFWSGATPPPPPIIVPSVGNWTSLGCYNDSTGARTLTVNQGVTGNFSIEACTEACFNAGYQFSGAEYADQCFCDTTINNGGAPALASDCDMPCDGNSSEFCGGPNRLNLYNYTGTNLPPIGNPQGPGGDPSSTPVFPVTSGLPAGWHYAACYVDNQFGRVFQSGNLAGSDLTIESCIAICQGSNFTLAGAEFADECYCGDSLDNAATVADESSCDMGCAGNTTEACGGPNRLSVYSSTTDITIYPVPTTKTTDLPGEWAYYGCLTDSGVRVFPYENIWTDNSTVEACLNQCAAFGYPAAGIEYGTQCFCGDVTDIATNGATLADEGDCNFPCTGDPTEFCGGALRLTTYTWNGDLNVWHTPSNIGRYEFLIGGVVVPLISTVGINNKVSFLEKSGTSEFPNSTGAYELDLSLVDNFSLAWREMHLKTDVFCSGSIILPDKGGRQINVGGWSLTSTWGIRLYTPDGSSGVNGTNDWEENPDELFLQRGRWYPTAVLLSNGSILVMGGESGSNGPPVPSLEILPRIPGGDTTITLDYLQRTDPNNLYPFLMILPSKNIFVGYYNEARILDPVTFATLKQLPNMPAAVDNFLGGRTYPLEGAAMLFPQFAPYTDPVRVLICGGSTPFAGIALDNCISIEPEVDNPTWTLERMPSQRVMPCMVSLPDGTYMIMNGAFQGQAGFGLANNPNLGALLYDPTLPVGQRISILNTTIVARLYHSEAALLPDGRVLISGSDPQTLNPDGTVKYPEEFRIEVYIPPYLNQGFRQPEFTITNTDWTYNGQYSITVNLFQGTTSTMRVSLISATSSTHGNTMGARTIFPAFSCTGNTCTITAPPNSGVSPPGWFQLFILDGPTPSHSQWVRIGGDPAQLGLWPDFPDFTVPGI